MKHAARISVIVLALVIALPHCARATGPGGGHGGSGGGHGSSGHGSSGHGGHAGHSSGNSSGHSLGHSFAHIFAHHAKISPASAKTIPRRPRWVAAGHPIGFVPARRHFGSSPCWNNIFFPRRANGFNCFDNDFFFDPFLFGTFSIFGAVTDHSYGYALADSAPSEEPSDAGNDSASFASAGKDGNPVTLLQLLDGSMYGLTNYRVVGHDLHYTTTYGGQNSIPLDRIDFTQTLKLNAERHFPFLLEPKSPPS
jgi:hypothetical protein